MSEPTFSYSGKALAAELESLLKRQEVEVAELDAKLAAMPAAVVEAAQSPPNLMQNRAPSAEEAAARRILADQITLRVGQLETEHWLAECYRTPGACWVLDLADLGRIRSREATLKAIEAGRTARAVTAPTQQQTLAP